jgi:N-acetylneuraminic acid mutarotase
LNDLWEYDPNTNEWRWLKGANFTNGTGIYGTKGTAASNNTPGARSEIGGVQRDGKFYLFGGLNPSFNYFNDVWEFDPAVGQWRWIAGSSITPVSGGLITAAGIDDPGNFPGGRSSTGGAWSLGNFVYFFSGNGRGVSGNSNLIQNDLWRLNLVPPATTIYTFTGSGQWSNTANWSGGNLPSNPLPSGAQITINGSGDCVLDVQQVILPGALLSVSQGRRLVVQGNLTNQ